jgi:hypothetical protein
MKLLIGNYLQQTMQDRLGFGIDRVLIKREGQMFLFLHQTGCLKSKAWALLKEVWSRECFVEIYIDYQCKIVIV